MTRTRVPFAGSVDSELAVGAYGQIAVGQLEDLGYAAEDVARAYATHFRVVGRTCSLLMLESKEDYERYDISPAEDALVVKERPAANTVRETLARLGDTLADPKARFLAWMERLERMAGKTTGVGFEIPKALRIAVGRIPGSSFAITPDALVCKVRTWSQVPGEISEQLASRKLQYDSISAEAERRRERQGAADGLKALSSLVEQSPGDMVLARDLGLTALEWGLSGQAYWLFRRAAEARPFEPHGYRAMAGCAAAMGRDDLALLYYELALAGTWDERFGAFARIASVDYLGFLREVARGERTVSAPDFARSRLDALRKKAGFEHADIVVILAWNTDRTDVDLHVTDPTGEVCYYQHNKTAMGGSLTTDVTSGFGPEMFVLPRAAPGPYKVQAKFFSSDALRVSARTKVLVTIYEDWGRPNERVTRRTVTLAYGQEMHDVATVKR